MFSRVIKFILCKPFEAKGFIDHSLKSTVFQLYKSRVNHKTKVKREKEKRNDVALSISEDGLKNLCYVVLQQSLFVVSIGCKGKVIVI